MHIRRFEAPTIGEALQQVKQELGPDALVLSHRTIRRDRGWFGAVGQPVVVVTAAVDRETLRASEDEQTPRAAPDRSWQVLQMMRTLVEPIESELRELRGNVESLAQRPHTQGGFARELAEMRQATRDLRHAAGVGAWEGVEAEAVGVLLQAGLAPRHALSLAREVAHCEPDSARSTRAALARSVEAHLERRIAPALSDDLPRVDLFVGPTGVGKTTTLAKVAAWEGLGADATALVTTDALRLGAQAQLRGYARRIGVGFHVATSPEALRRNRVKHRHRVLLVDTAGRGGRDPHAIPELLRCRDALGEHVRVHLVLSATTKDDDLMGQVERFRPLCPDALVLTKLDESARLGNLANLLLDPELPPVSWLTDGQRVPGDLHAPDARQLAGQILGGAS